MSIEQGRNADILQSIVDGTPYENTNPYPSRIEVLLMELKEAIESGGQGGDPALVKKVNAIEAQLFSTIANIQTNTDSGSMDLYSKDLNSIVTSGFYNAMTCTNAPADYCTLIVTGYYLTGYCTQIAMDVTTGKFYTRTQSNNTWGTWIEKTNAADLASVAAALNDKVDKVAGKALSTNDYTTAEKNKLAGLSNYDDSSVRAALQSKIEMDNVFGSGTEIRANEDLNDLTAHGIYYSVNAARSASLSNCPVSDSGFLLESSYGTATIIQNLYPIAKTLAGVFYSRRFGSGSWGSWYRFEGTAVQ